MELHEYQTKSLLQRFGIPTAPYVVLNQFEPIEEQIRRSGFTQGVVKIQIYAGGRGKAGGVKIGKTQEELIAISQELLGKRFITAQTGPKGLIASSLLLTTLVDIQQEYYISVVVDRKEADVVVIASREGGVEIEEIAQRDPKKIIKVKVPDSKRLHHFQMVQLLADLQWPEEMGSKIINALTDAFFRYEFLSLEINPLVKTSQGTFLALDAKATVDDNALFRQKEVASLCDTSQIAPLELEARGANLAYIAMEGDIGCMVNGAGLAMATMDLIHFWGGKPANFLDVGGGATEERVTTGFEILLKDPSVKAVLVNIFGGIMNCEVIARALIKAVEQSPRQVPIVVRLEGTHVLEAKALLKKSKLSLSFAKDFDDAAKEVVKLCRSY